MGQYWFGPDSGVEGGNVREILEKYGKNIWSNICGATAWPVIGKVERLRNFGQLPRLLVWWQPITPRCDGKEVSRFGSNVAKNQF